MNCIVENIFNKYLPVFSTSALECHSEIYVETMSSPWYDVLYKLVTGEIEPIKALNHARSVSRLNITFAEDTATSSKLNQISTAVPCPENTVTSMNVRNLRP